MVDDVVGGDGDAVPAVQQLNKRGVELDLARDGELELFARSSLSRGPQREQQDRRGRSGRSADGRPARHTPREVQSAQAALFEVLDRLCVDGAHPARRVGALIEIGKQRAQHDATPLAQCFDRGHGCAVEIEGARSERAVVQ